MLVSLPEAKPQLMTFRVPFFALAIILSPSTRESSPLSPGHEILPESILHEALDVPPEDLAIVHVMTLAEIVQTILV